MKKVILFVVLIFLLMLPLKVNAECSYQEQAKLNMFATNVNYSYTYAGNITKFDVTLHNVKKGLYIIFNEKKIYPNSEEKIIIKDVNNKDNNKIVIYSNVDSYQDEILPINLYLPFYNEYYNENDCKEKPDSNSCIKYVTAVNTEEEIESGTKARDAELDAYLKNRKEESTTTVITRKIINFFTKENIVLLILIGLFILFIMVFIGKIKRNIKLKF